MKVIAKVSWIFLGLPLSVLADSTLPPPSQLQVDFRQHVQPILAPTATPATVPNSGGLACASTSGRMRYGVGTTGPVIIPGKSSESKLILRLVNGAGGMQMPPTGPLAAEDIGILRAWMDQGGEFGDVEIKEAVAAKPVDPQLKALIAATRSQDLTRLRKMVAANRRLVQGQGHRWVHTVASRGRLRERRRNSRAAQSRRRRECSEQPRRYAAALVCGRRGEDPAAAGQGCAHQHTDRDRTHGTLSGGVPQRQGRRGASASEQGPRPNLSTLPGRTPLMAASAEGEVTAMRLLLEKGANPKAASGTGSTALFDAARSRGVEAVRLLLDAGADVNTLTKRRESVLGLAAMQGAEGIVKLLLERGAQVNGQDERGYSPLMYAAYSEAASAEVVRMLLARGADASVTGEGETPQSLAGKRGDNEVARLLGVPEAQRKSGGVAAVANPLREDRSPSEAVQRAFVLLEKQSPTFVKRGGCNSCHNQYLPAAALALARERGIPVPKMLVEVSREMRETSPERVMELDTFGVNSLGYEMFSNAATGQPADEYTDAVVHFIKVMQTPAGYWRTPGNRPPLTFDLYITAAMAINTLRLYAPAAQRADTEKRLARAASWLESSRPTTTQERAFHLLGLHWAKGSAVVIERAARSLVETQRADGGWSQLPTMGSDAYATGEALYALHLAGKMRASDPVYQRGVRYLLRTQAPSGTWHVKTRSLPVQPYFDSGFPYGHDQWISAAGTGWAAMALALTVEPQRISRR